MRTQIGSTTLVFTLKNISLGVVKPRDYRGRIISFVLSIVFCIAVTATQANAAGIGSTATDFTLYDQDNMEISLSDFAGTGVILDFCAMWCGPCQTFYNDFYDTMPGYTLVLPVLMENYYATGASDQGDAAIWANAFDLETVAHLNGDEAIKSELTSDYLLGVEGFGYSYPTFVFIDANLTVVGNIVGVVGADSVEWANYVVSIEASQVVPVPAAAWLFGSGLMGLVGLARRKR